MSFPRLWLIPGFVTTVTQRVSLVEQGLLTIREHMSSPPVFSGVRVAQSSVFWVEFGPFSVGHCIVSDYPFDIFKLFLNLLSEVCLLYCLYMYLPTCTLGIKVLTWPIRVQIIYARCNFKQKGSFLFVVFFSLNLMGCTQNVF